MKQQHQHEWLPLSSAALIATALFVAFRERGFDDPFITYRYAANIAAGHGFVYNDGERVLSTTTPLYTLLLSGAAWLGFDIPLTSNAIGCLALALGGLALYGLARAYQQPLVGWVGLLCYPTFPLMVATLGGEMAFYVGCILWSWLYYERKRFTIAAILCALATLTRADGVLVVGVMGCFLLVERVQGLGVRVQGLGVRVLGSRFSVLRSALCALRSALCALRSALSALRSALSALTRLPWRALLIYSVLLLPWCIFAWVYFGSPIPVTLAVKRQQGHLLISDSFYTGLGGLVQNYWRQPFYQIHLSIALIGLCVAPFRYRRWLPVIGWSILYAVAYSLLGVTRYFWYYGPLIPAYTICLGLGIQLLKDLSGVRRSQIAAYGTLGALLLVQLSILTRLPPDPRSALYREVGTWLHTHTAPDARIGALEVGGIGYYAQRPIIDFAGLIQPDVATQFTPTATYENAARYAIDRYQPSYIVLANGALPTIEQALRGDERCREAHTISDGALTLRVYQCVEKKTGTATPERLCIIERTIIRRYFVQQ